MALSDPRDWLIAYDISDRRRLVRVHRLMVKHAIPLQRSVFTAKMSVRQARSLKDELARLVNPQEDDIRMYPLPSHPQIDRLGVQDLPSSGVFLP